MQQRYNRPDLACHEQAGGFIGFGGQAGLFERLPVNRRLAANRAQQDHHIARRGRTLYPLPAVIDREALVQQPPDAPGDQFGFEDGLIGLRRILCAALVRRKGFPAGVEQQHLGLVSGVARLRTSPAGRYRLSRPAPVRANGNCA